MQSTAPTSTGDSQRTRATPPAFIWIPAVAVALAMLLPPVYLGARTAGASTEALGLIFSASTLAILTRSIVLVVLVTAICTLIGVGVAWLTIRSDMPFKRLFTVLTALPLVIPSYVFALLVVLALGPKGTVQSLLEPLGVDRMPSIFGLPGAVLTLSLLSFPYLLLPVRAALHRIDPAMEEAARSLGRGAWATFWQVTMPLLRPAVIAGALLVALYTLSDFGAVSLLRYQTFTWAIFIQFQSAWDASITAGLSLVLVVLATTILFLESWTRGRGRVHRVTPGTARAPSLVKLGRWRWPATGAVGLLVFLSLVAPIALLVFWVARGIGAGESLSSFWGDIVGTLLVSLSAAVAAAFAGVPIAMLTVRYPSLAASALERLTFIGFALPGVTVALAFVFFASAIAKPLYGTSILLVIAYLVLFLPASVGATQASLKQVSPRIEEAARGLGKTSFQAFRLITLPLVVRGVVAGGSLVFLLTMKELPATLILAPIGFNTLATSVWAAASEAFFARAALPALALVIMASIPLAVIAIRDRNDGSHTPSA